MGRRTGVVLELVVGASAATMSLSIAVTQATKGSGVIDLILLPVALLSVLTLGLTGMGWIVADRVLIGSFMWIARGIAVLALLGLLADGRCATDTGCGPIDFTRHHRMLAFLAVWGFASALALWAATKDRAIEPEPASTAP